MYLPVEEGKRAIYEIQNNDIIEAINIMIYITFIINFLIMRYHLSYYL